MEHTSKIEFIFMFSSFEVQLWRTFGYISFLQVITGDSGSCMIIILSGQNQKKEILLVCFIQASSKTNNCHKVVAVCTRLHA